MPHLEVHADHDWGRDRREHGSRADEAGRETQVLDTLRKALLTGESWRLANTKCVACMHDASAVQGGRCIVTDRSGRPKPATGQLRRLGSGSDRKIRGDGSARSAYFICALLSVAFIVSNSFVIDGHRYFGVFDDAMISMRYGRNVAHGHGLLWNVGAPPVEGYTNFLWTLWMAALHALPVSERVAPLLVMVSGAGLLLANLRVVHLLAERLAPGTMAGLAAVWITTFSFPLLFWTLLGMEVGLVAFLLSLAALLAVRWQQEGRPADRVWLGVVLCLSVLARTDAVLPALIIVAYLWITADRWRVAAVALPMVAVLGTLAVHTAFRLVYYGEPLPNTYYLKVAGIGLGTRLRRGGGDLLTSIIYGLYAPLAVVGAWFIAKHRAVSPATLLLVSLVTGQCAYSVYVGGDTYDSATIANRYVAVVVPLLAVLVGVALADLTSTASAKRPRTLMAWVALGALAVVGVAAGAGVRFGLHSQLGGVPALPVVGWRLLPPLAVAVTILAVITFLRRRPQWAFACVALAVTVAFTGRDMWTWARYNTAAAAFSKQMTRFGLDLRRATDDRAVIATGAAGAIGYYSHRQVVDLLGYSDRHIAHERPATPVFIPGHNKFDYTYSVLRLRPDVVANVAPIPVSDAQAMERIGYQQVGLGVYVRIDSPYVDRPALDQAVARLYAPE